MEHLKQETVSGAQLNMDALYQICPQCFTESKDPKTGEVRRSVDFEKLRLLLGDNVAEGDERYDFTWVGKRAALQEAAKPIRKTLRACPEESVDWENTKNLYIEGDNLEVLKLLQNSYMGKVKMIYIDPPYNTGNDFVYHDDFYDDSYEEHNYNEDGERLLSRNQVTHDGKLIRNTDSNGRFHSDWCSMIYSRLMVARSLLTEDGVIFISIDDNEQRNLKNICDEVFGESNWLITMSVNRASEIATDKTIQKHEYCLVYSKSIYSIGMCGKKQYSISRGTVGNVDQTMPEITFPKGLKCVNIQDGVYNLSRQIENSRENIEVLSPFVVKNGILAEDVILKARWRSSNDMRNFFANKCKPTQAKINGLIEEIYFDGDRFMPYIKKLVTEKIPSLYLDNKRGSTDLVSINMNFFDFPKSVQTIGQFVSYVTTNDDLILDFFSGSATTAHAVMQLNAEDGGNRKFIMIQLTEETTEDSEAYKAGYKNICEIGKERIRRAGKKILEERKAKQADLFSGEQKKLDVGFRVFKCADSNMKDVYYAPAEYSQELLLGLEDNIKEDRNDLDLLFGCMLDWGVTLDLPLRSEKVDGINIYIVNEGDLVACFEKHIPESVIDHIASLLPMRVVLRDSCFDEAKEKMNFFEIFKQRTGWSEEEVRKNVRVI